MKRNYQKEMDSRIAFIREVLETAQADGIVFGNSGGKDSALVGILCKAACDNTVGIIMPCQSTRNYGQDKSDAGVLASQFGIASMLVDLTDVKKDLLEKITPAESVKDTAAANIAPRLRMTTLYTVAQSKNALVAGTGNKSELTMGYFTKWGDGACDFNPIADLTATEVLEFLRFLKAPDSIIEKPPSAGLFEGQTDEEDMEISYADLDRFILTHKGNPDVLEKIMQAHRRTGHKRSLPIFYDEFYGEE